MLVLQLADLFENTTYFYCKDYYFCDTRVILLKHNAFIVNFEQIPAFEHVFVALIFVLPCRKGVS